MEGYIEGVNWLLPCTAPVSPPHRPFFHRTFSVAQRALKLKQVERGNRERYSAECDHECQLQTGPIQLRRGRRGTRRGLLDVWVHRAPNIRRASSAVLTVRPTRKLPAPSR